MEGYTYLVLVVIEGMDYYSARFLVAAAVAAVGDGTLLVRNLCLNYGRDRKGDDK